MIFSKGNAPYIKDSQTVQNMMLKVVYALIPGTLAAIWFFGWGVVFNLIIAIGVCLVSEAVFLKLRNRPIEPTLKDGSALVTACLLALALPPLVPWWLTVVASLFAIVVAKQLYGGLGFNPFNPAMVGYVVVLISFPREMTLWTPPYGIGAESLGFIDTLQMTLSGAIPQGLTIDSITMATPIDTINTQLNLEYDIESTRGHRLYGTLFGTFSGIGWEWINILYLAGGIWLVRNNIVDWRIPTSFLIGLLFISNLFAVVDFSSYSSSLFHLLSGGTMLCAFFIATDPVTASTTPKGRWIYGAGIAVLVYIIRTWGGYPDGIAFAVLIMNACVPLIDHYTKPTTYGNIENQA